MDIFSFSARNSTSEGSITKNFQVANVDGFRNTTSFNELLNTATIISYNDPFRHVFPRLIIWTSRRLEENWAEIPWGALRDDCRLLYVTNHMINLWQSERLVRFILSAILERGKMAETTQMLSFHELFFNVDSGYLEGLVRGFRSGILNQSDYLNLSQCETLEGKKLANIFSI